MSELLTTLRARITPNVLKSAVRFAVAIVIADSIAWWVFRDGTPVVLGAFGVISLLYFIDFSGDARERLVGYSSAALVGLGAVLLGSLLAQSVLVAVVGAFVVSSLFAFTRVLRGYVARASIGLQGAFFFPLMADVSIAEIPSLAGAWLIGSVVAFLCALFVLPNENSGVIRQLLSEWLTEASSFTTRLERGSVSSDQLTSMESTVTSLEEAIDSSGTQPGSVGQRDRALAEMVASARWSMPMLSELHSVKNVEVQGDTSALPLLDASAQAFTCASTAVLLSESPETVPDLPKARKQDLTDVVNASSSQLLMHYPARLISIVAMRMLWLSGNSSGRHFPTPDIGDTKSQSPAYLLRINATWGSVWFRNALRTGAGSAACVLLVRELGLQHGLWVVLAALSVTQVSFSATKGGASSLRMAAGAAAGVLVASIGVLLDLPHIAFIALVPFLAFFAVIGSHIGMFTSQFLFTPFALANLAAIEWATDRDLEATRVENIALGAIVAAVFTFAVFPFGVRKQLSSFIKATNESSRSYLLFAISAAEGSDSQAGREMRATCIKDLSMLESTLNAVCVRPVLPQVDLNVAQDVDDRARNRVMGGDACMDLAVQRSNNPAIIPVSNAFAAWWASSAMVDP